VLFLDWCAGWVCAFLEALGLSSGGGRCCNDMAGKCPGGVGLVQEMSRGKVWYHRIANVTLYWFMAVIRLSDLSGMGDGIVLSRMRWLW
jgi:hypothetical protein